MAGSKILAKWEILVFYVLIMRKQLQIRRGIYRKS